MTTAQSPPNGRHRNDTSHHRKEAALDERDIKRLAYLIPLGNTESIAADHPWIAAARAGRHWKNLKVAARSIRLSDDEWLQQYLAEPVRDLSGSRFINLATSVYAKGWATCT